MNLIGKKFQNKSGKVCTIKDINENITVFDDNTRVETRYLLDKKYFVEIPQQTNQNSYTQVDKLDPNFLNTQRNPILEQIRSLSNDMIEKLPPDNSTPRNNYYPNDNTFAVLPEDPEMEKAELARKYGINSNATANNAIEQANAQMNRLLNDPKYGKMIAEETGYQPQQAQVAQQQPVVQPFVPQQPVVQQQNYDYQQQTRQVDPVVETRYPQQNNYVDPIISMFQKAKRTNSFKITFEIDKKIPRLDFIEMMEDSYETSIIEYLAQEFTEQILANPLSLKDKIADKLRMMLEAKTGKKRVEIEEEIQDIIPEKKKPKKAKEEDVKVEEILEEILPKNNEEENDR